MVVVLDWTAGIGDGETGHGGAAAAARGKSVAVKVEASMTSPQAAASRPRTFSHAEPFTVLSVSTGLDVSHGS